jgi:Na+/H+-dicarboxylate symporter
VAVTLLIHVLITYPTLLSLFAQLNPLILLKKMRPALLFAFSTSSSAATLPVTMEVARKRLGVGKSTASFTLPLGATINMDGTAIMQGVATVFIAQLYGVDLTMTQYLTVILMATLASIGTAGVPSVGLVMLTMVLNQVNLPSEAIGMLLGIDRLLDMMRTAVNITGDATVACIVAKSEGDLDIETYNNPYAGLRFEQN